jgi:hypothetical protein
MDHSRTFSTVSALPISQCFLELEAYKCDTPRELSLSHARSYFHPCLLISDKSEGWREAAYRVGDLFGMSVQRCSVAELTLSAPKPTPWPDIFKTRSNAKTRTFQVSTWVGIAANQPVKLSPTPTCILSPDEKEMSQIPEAACGVWFL